MTIRTPLTLAILALSTLAASACGPRPEFEELEGLWGRVDEGEHQIWELRREIDATGLVDVLPAFRRWQYGLDEAPREVARGRWNNFKDEIVFTPAWSLITDAERSPDLVLNANENLVVVIDDYSPVDLLLVYPGEEEPRVYVKLEQLPESGPE